MSSLRPQGRAERQAGVPFRDPRHRVPASSSPALGAVHGNDTAAGLHYMANEDNRADPGIDGSRHGNGTNQYAEWTPSADGAQLEHP
ncbi:MAG: hypothetical protein ACRDTA_21550 [Pseudonocardiaceae bacterium]